MSKGDRLKWLLALKEWSRDLSHRTLAICLSVAAFASFVLTFKPPILYEFLGAQERHLQDQFFSWRNLLGQPFVRERIPTDNLLLVSVDYESARRLGMPLPWPRQLYALLAGRLREAGAKVIAFNLLFDGPSPILSGTKAELSPRLKALAPGDFGAAWSESGAGDDKALSDQFKLMRNVVLADNVEVSVNLYNGRTRFFFRTPYEPFIFALGADAGSVGNADLEPDGDAVVRRAMLYFKDFSNLPVFSHSFALRVAEKAERTRAFVEPGNRVFLSNKVLPYSFRINFVGPAGTVRSIPFWQAVDWKRHFATNPFADKIVLIGYQESLAAEQVVSKGLPTLPFHSFLTPIAGFPRPMSGVELQSNIIANVLSGHILSEPELWEQILIVLFVALLLARALDRLQGRPWSMVAFIAGFAAVWLVASFFCFLYLECMVPVVVPIFGVALPAWFIALTDQNLYFIGERRRHTKVFRYLAPQSLAEEISRRQLEELGLEGKSALVTTLACQLQNFVEITEEKSPAAVISMLNECLSVIDESVYDHNGIVIRTSSCGIMAVWGAPLAIPEISQARLAASCALNMQQRLSDLAERWQRDGRMSSRRTLRLCFGIATGEASCGRTGSEAHTDYSVVGISVDLSTLLESVNKRYGTQCLTAERTAQLIAQHFELRELDKVKVNQDDKPQYVYELFCLKGKLPGAMEEATAFYRQGLAALEERNFAEAERLFATILRLVPDDKPAAIMLERCREFLAKPPEPDWDGATLVADFM